MQFGLRGLECQATDGHYDAWPQNGMLWNERSDYGSYWAFWKCHWRRRSAAAERSRGTSASSPLQRRTNTTDTCLFLSEFPSQALFILSVRWCPAQSQETAQKVSVVSVVRASVTGQPGLCSPRCRSLQNST